MESGNITVERFGWDHWSLLVYIETLCVDYKGLIDPRKMRCHARRHRIYYQGSDGRSHPTRLQNGETVSNHDDWDCLTDLVAAGYVEITDDYAAPFPRHMGFPQREPTTVFPMRTCEVRLTDLGWSTAWQLRRHRAEGGTYDTFTVLAEV